MLCLEIKFRYPAKFWNILANNLRSEYNSFYMQLIVGLGNPGEEYRNTRHNAGFILIDKLRDKLSFTDFQHIPKFDALIAAGEYQGKKLFLFKPNLFMNRSGQSLVKFVDFYKIPKNEMCVLYDDVDLKLGSFRYRKSGSAGTHNGMRSVVQAFGDTDFHRLRLGIESRGESSSVQEDISSFVLHKFSKEETLIFNRVIDEAADYLINLLKSN